MKKLILTAISFIALSCGSDDDEQQLQTENLLIGQWKMKTSIVVSGKDKTTVLKEYLPDACKQKSIYEFTDKKYIMNDYNMIANECKLNSITVDYIYNYNDKTIKIENRTADILELTKNSLIAFTFDDYDYNDDGIKDYVKDVFIK